ncbi:unnamed protein product, partial [marine sediment metagenome]
SLLLTPRIISDISKLEHYQHSRWRVYPQVVSDTAHLVAGTPANTFGDWVQIVPIDIVPFHFDVIGVVVEEVDAVTTYHIQLGYSLTAASPGANYEAGERRFRIATLPIARGTELLDIRGQDTPANSSVWGRLKTASGATDTADISVVLSRHVEVSAPIPKWTAFPW